MKSPRPVVWLSLLLGLVAIGIAVFWRSRGIESPGRDSAASARATKAVVPAETVAEAKMPDVSQRRADLTTQLPGTAATPSRVSPGDGAAVAPKAKRSDPAEAEGEEI
ncbi:MAG: hypothetical protein ABIR80_00920, partial [Opitutaceae bacterium]